MIFIRQFTFQNQNDRIYCYNPQQLIDFTKINRNEALEIPAPDEVSIPTFLFTFKIKKVLRVKSYFEGICRNVNVGT